MILGPLYHWSPANRRALITANGLRPHQRPTVATTVQRHICLGFDPSGAWAVSGDMDWLTGVEEWDLYQVQLAPSDPVHVCPAYGPGLQEVKIAGPIPADRIWRVGTRRRAPQPKGGESTRRNDSDCVGDLRSARISLGLSQAEVARRMGRSQSAVSHIETGEVTPDVLTLVAYGAAVGIQVTTTLEPIDHSAEGAAWPISAP